MQYKIPEFITKSGEINISFGNTCFDVVYVFVLACVYVFLCHCVLEFICVFPGLPLYIRSPEKFRVPAVAKAVRSQLSLFV